VNRKIKVYLSGDMYSNWQDLMIESDCIEYLDPRKFSYQNKGMGEFVNQDINKVIESDFVFCYMSEDNPSGFGATWECAVANQHNIPIITVWGKDYIDPFFATKSMYLYTSLQKGIAKICSLATHKHLELNTVTTVDKN